MSEISSTGLKMAKLQIVVPQGAVPGSQIQAIDPTNGVPFPVTIPAGAVVGQTIDVEAPEAPPDLAPPAEPTKLQIVVPPGITAGTTIQAINPTNNQPFPFTIPEGVQPGDTVDVEAPPHPVANKQSFVPVNSPGEVITPSNVVMVQPTTMVITRGVTRFPELPVTIVCPVCNHLVATKTTHVPGCMSFFCCSLCFFSGLWCCCLIPYFAFQDTVHECPHCHTVLGTHNHL